MIYGYCRVSTTRQNRQQDGLAAQREELEAAGAKMVYQDTFTSIRSERPELQKLLQILEPGDTLVVARIDLLAPTVKEVNVIIMDLLDRNVYVHVLNMGLMNNTATGQIMRTMMVAFAEFEKDMIVQRTQEGKAIASERPGFRDGRPPKFTEEQIAEALKLLEDHSYSQVASMTGISRATLQRARSAQKQQEAAEGGKKA